MFEVVDSRGARHFVRGWYGLLSIVRTLEIARDPSSSASCETRRPLGFLGEVCLDLLDMRGTLCPAPLYSASRIVSGWGLNDAPAGWAGSFPYRDGAWDWDDYGPPDDLLDIYELSSSCVEEVGHA